MIQLTKLKLIFTIHLNKTQFFLYTCNRQPSIKLKSLKGVPTMPRPNCPPEAEIIGQAMLACINNIQVEEIRPLLEKTWLSRYSARRMVSGAALAECYQ